MPKRPALAARYRVRIPNETPLAKYLETLSDPGFAIYELAAVGLAARSLLADPRVLLAGHAAAAADAATTATPGYPAPSATHPSTGAARPADEHGGPLWDLSLDALANLGSTGRQPAEPAGAGS